MNIFCTNLAIFVLHSVSTDTQVAHAQPARPPAESFGEKHDLHDADPLSLKQILLTVIQSNPEIAARRAEVNAQREDIAIARSGALPFLEAQSSLNYLDQTDTFGVAQDFEISGLTTSVGIELTQPLFRGFGVQNAIRRTRTEIEAADAGTRAIEQDVLLRAITAYADVVRDAAIVRFTDENIAILRRQLRLAKSQFSLGDGTRTDVEQAQTAVLLAESNRARTIGTLSASKARLEALTGSLMVGELAPLPSIPEVPKTLEELIGAALTDNPIALEAKLLSKSANFRIREERSRWLPQLDFITRADRLTLPVPRPEMLLPDSTDESDEPDEPGKSQALSFTTGVQLRVPLYQRGEVRSDVRRARAEQSRRRFAEHDRRNRVVQDAKTAWHGFRASELSIEFTRRAVQSAQLAAAGTRIEAEANTRNIFDILNSESALLSANSALAEAERDFHIAAYTLLASAGRLHSGELEL